MKWTKANDSGIITRVFNTEAEAVEFYDTCDYIRPVFGFDEYNGLNNDYKMVKDGQTYALILNERRGTILSPCYVVNEL